MKICWDTIEGAALTRNGFFKIKNSCLIERDCCKRCGEAYLTPNSRQSDYCSISCLKKDTKVSEATKKKLRESLSGSKHPWYGRKHSEESKKKMSVSSTGKMHTNDTKLKMSLDRSGSNNHFYGKKHSEDTKQKISNNNKGKLVGESNHAYKGGVSKLNLPLYETYAKQLSWCEDVSKIECNGLIILQVRCSNNKCNKWFTPTAIQVQNRIQVLKDNYTGNNRFYCSNDCKDKCLIYNKPINTFINQKQYSSYELMLWSKEILKRADYKCEYCGKKAVIAHHIRPKKIEPAYALDPDNGIACCQECHYKYGHKDECSTINIANKRC